MNHPSQSPLGYSWGVPTTKWRDSDGEHNGGIRRFHVCPKCLDPKDQFDVIVEQVPRRDADKPSCYRCGALLGLSTV